MSEKRVEEEEEEEEEKQFRYCSADL